MKMVNKYITCIAVGAAVCLLSGCAEQEWIPEQQSSAANKIQIGGMTTDELEVSVATSREGSKSDAETIKWLLSPLKQGIDITYGLYGVPEAESHQDVAILTLKDSDGDKGANYDTENGLAVYSFLYREDRTGRPGVNAKNEAIWYNNGPHYFQGVHVPERIRYTNNNIADVENNDKAPGLVTDQHDATDTGTLGNYTLLSHYLGMPANYRVTATVERIKLPFRHRLARVVAFVLIDPELRTTLKGYKKNADGTTSATEDPTTTSFRFCNVQVLQGVQDVLESGTAENGHHRLTPKWKEARKVIPHFDGEKGSYNYENNQILADNFLFYYKNEEGELDELYPTSKGWSSVHNATNHNGYTEVNYGKVPVYDIIVRPTYTSTDNVMYDEENYASQKTALANEKNSIVFDLELENGLSYEKKFEFDLNANYQTVVYLRIGREHVDYNASNAELWKQDLDVSDNWYGVDNENGNILSMAGSSWQRAYRSALSFTAANDTITDGDFYNHTSESMGQYIGDPNKWLELLFQAREDGKHHGDYFILDQNIEVDATKIPKDFVFTGHLDAQDHTITLSASSIGKNVYKDAVNITDPLYRLVAGNYTEWSIPTLYVKLVTPVYYEAGELQVVNGVSYVRETLQWVEKQVIHYTQDECNEENAKPEHHKQKLVTDSKDREPEDEDYEETWGAGPDNYVDGYELWTTEKVKETIPAHYVVNETSKPATIETVKRYDTTYPEATATTSPTKPTTLEQLKTAEYYINNTGTSFNFNDYGPLYQFSHVSPNYLFKELKGDYTTNQEQAPNPYSAGVVWQANVHKETNSYGTFWVPALGYRAEVINTVVKGGTLFPERATNSTITGNVQNCFNKTQDSQTAVTFTPAIPVYK